MASTMEFESLSKVHSPQRQIVVCHSFSLTRLPNTNTHAAQFADGYSRTLHRATPTVDASGEKPSYWMPPGSPRVATGSSVGGAASVTRPASPSSNSRHRDKRVPMNSKMYQQRQHTALKPTNMLTFMLAYQHLHRAAKAVGSLQPKVDALETSVRGAESEVHRVHSHPTNATPHTLNNTTHRPHRWRY